MMTTLQKMEERKRRAKRGRPVEKRRRVERKRRSERMRVKRRKSSPPRTGQRGTVTTPSARCLPARSRARDAAASTARPGHPPLQTLALVCQQ
ncbi:hypothetical protein JYU34_007220 [Plutella xylostella]|uniref:Uncharacterized protein n=1 Tax=Plutella xylostella TaxID=51655 RepID=A0ABQ7QPW0_PLUXY|nr:hypothetical protein JYU34_007220 [Plutella xylostella]